MNSQQTAAPTVSSPASIAVGALSRRSLQASAAGPRSTLFADARGVDDWLEERFESADEPAAV
jgi:hypothetical protein